MLHFMPPCLPEHNTCFSFFRSRPQSRFLFFFLSPLFYYTSSTDTTAAMWPPVPVSCLCFMCEVGKAGMVKESMICRPGWAVQTVGPVLHVLLEVDYQYMASGQHLHSPS